MLAAALTCFHVINSTPQGTRLVKDIRCSGDGVFIIFNWGHFAAAYFLFKKCVVDCGYDEIPAGSPEVCATVKRIVCENRAQRSAKQTLSM